MRGLALAACLAAAQTSADEAREASPTLQRNFEMPAHRSLVAKIGTAPLTPFETDGCSGGLSTSWRVVADLFPDFSEKHDQTPPWEQCCVVHDRAYHDAGGTTTAEASYTARLTADEALRQCVIDQGRTRRDTLSTGYEVSPELIDRAYAAIGDTMFNAVRFGGGPCSGLPWRWGFGHPPCVPGL